MRGLYILKMFFVCGLLLSALSAIGQDQPLKPIPALVKNYQLEKGSFPSKNLFESTPEKYQAPFTELKDFTSLTLDQQKLEELVKGKEDGIELTVPYKNGELKVDLVKVDLFTSDFKVVTDESAGEPVDYVPGVYYRGIVAGDDHSLASFSFFDGEMEGIISTGEGNIVIGKLQDGNPLETSYVVYNDKDFRSSHAYSCATAENSGYATKLQEYISNGSTLRTTNCGRLYYELDHDIYTLSGNSISGSVNWITAIHNNIAAIYFGDNINIALSEIFIWTNADPYNATSAITQLNSFKTFRASFNGDVGQLVSMEPGSLGGVATLVNALCNDADKYCYSDVDYSFSTIPMYSWTVNVIAHEFGHLLGSFHTHNCSWPGGAIDDCGPLAGYPNEGTCVWGPDPVNGGTIMSYCQLTEFGINFNNGFGFLPASAIRGAMDASSCLSPSCIPNLPSYCLSIGQTNSEWIESVQCVASNFVNNSGAGTGYSDFTNQVIPFQPGAIASLVLTPGYAGTHYKEYFNIWIDYNKDLDFYDGNENVYTSGSVNVPVTANFLIQQGLTGTTRMRISMKFDSVPTPCESFKYGEVEDYTVSFTPPIAYCGSKGKNSEKEWIDLVNLGAINRISGSDNGYFDATSSSTLLALNSTNTITFSSAFSNQTYKEYWKIWIDYNGNGVFEVNEKIVNRTSSKPAEQIKAFIVPATAVIGKTRMRVSMMRHGEQTPCDTFTHGEVEDYSVIIAPQQVGLASTEKYVAKVFPNPASSQITVQLSDELSSSANVEVIDLAGRILQKSMVPDHTTLINLNISNLPPGIYLVRIASADRTMITQKWIKE
jgi:hypothetical protein